MMPGWFILKVSLLLPNMIILFSVSLEQYWISTMHLHPFYSDMFFVFSFLFFLRNLAFQLSLLMLCSFFSDDPHHFLYVLFSTSLHYFREKKMVFLKFSTQALFTFPYSVSFAGFLRCTWRKQTDKNTRQRIANLLNCDSDISLYIKILRYFDMLSRLC